MAPFVVELTGDLDLAGLGPNRVGYRPLCVALAASLLTSTRL